jgi:hypothetical protein
MWLPPGGKKAGMREWTAGCSILKKAKQMKAIKANIHVRRKITLRPAPRPEPLPGGARGRKPEEHA